MIGLRERRPTLSDDITKTMYELNEDLKFLKEGEKQSRDKYNKRIEHSNASKDALFALT